ncbi:MAG: hypothetical protein WD359_10195 [Dehalococcoidia bacterium]
MSLDAMAGLAQLVAVVIAAAALVVTLSGIRKQLWLTTFAEYTGRYIQILDEIPMAARREPQTFSLASQPDSERDRLLALAIRYLNLCSEEYYLFRKNIIDGRTWAIWEEEIVIALRRRWLVEAWGQVKTEYDSFVEFHALIERIIDAGRCQDPPDAQLPLAS